jgi:CDP-diacylglycerol--serine O-phosphatidyltransferase
MNRKLAYAIPNIFTAASLISALVALDLAAKGSFAHAAGLLTLSIILDGFDGKMAKILNATSKIGAQADSLSDFVAFGVVAGFLAWNFSLQNFGFIGFLVFVLYVLACGFRLARFNVMIEKNPKSEEFMGLPAPAAAAVVCSMIIFHELVASDIGLEIVLLFVMVFISYLMVSKIPYIAVNKGKKTKKLLSAMITVIATVTILAIWQIAWAYMVVIWGYVIYGLYNHTRKTLLAKVKKLRSKIKI